MYLMIDPDDNRIIQIENIKKVQWPHLTKI